MLRNQQNTVLVRGFIYPPHSYHLIAGSLQTIHQVRLVTTLPWVVYNECTMPYYGVAENVKTTAICASLKKNTSRLIVSISDRKHHIFCCRNYLPNDGYQSSLS